MLSFLAGSKDKGNNMIIPIITYRCLKTSIWKGSMAELVKANALKAFLGLVPIPGSSPGGTDPFLKSFIILILKIFL